MRSTRDLARELRTTPREILDARERLDVGSFVGSMWMYDDDESAEIRRYLEDDGEDNWKNGEEEDFESEEEEDADDDEREDADDDEADDN